MTFGVVSRSSVRRRTEERFVGSDAVVHLSRAARHQSDVVRRLDGRRGRLVDGDAMVALELWQRFEAERRDRQHDDGHREDGDNHSLLLVPSFLRQIKLLLRYLRVRGFAATEFHGLFSQCLKIRQIYDMINYI